MIAQLGRLEQLQRDYWTAFHTVLKESGSPMSRNVKPEALEYTYQDFGVGTSGFTLKVKFSIPKDQIDVGLYIDAGSYTRRREYFDLLKRERAGIEGDLLCCLPLDWEPRKVPRISARRENVNPEEKPNWCRQHEWLAKCLNSMHEVFAPRVKKLKQRRGA